MSDEKGDPAQSGADQEATELEISGDDLSGITDPALAGRLENIHRSMSTLGMRIDALVTSTTSYRSALTDRLNEYAELVTKLTRTQASELEEYRRANEKALSELRRTLTVSEESIERVGARIDSLVTDAESTDDASRRALAEVRSILDAQESLGRFLTESLDKFADEVMGRLSEVTNAGKVTTETWGELAGLKSKVDSVLEVTANEAGSVSALLDELRETLQDLASGEVVGALWDEFRSLRTGVDGVTEQISGRLSDQLDGLADNATVAAVSAEIRQLRGALDGLIARVDAAVEAEPGPEARLPDEVAQLNDAVRALLEQAEVVDDGAMAEEPDPRFEALLTDIAALREDLAAGLVVETADDMGETLENLQREMSSVGARLDELVAAATVEDGEEDETPEEDRLGPKLERLGWRLDEISNRLDDLASVAGEAPATPEVVDPTPKLDQLAAEIGAIADRLDEGLVLADDAPAAATGEALSEIADQVASLRDYASAEFSALREGTLAATTPTSAPAPETTVEVDLDPIHEALADVQAGLAHLLDREPTAAAGSAAGAGDDRYATIDPDVVDLLREEIRASGEPAADLIDALNAELKALRRRIRLRAEGEIFSDEQLELIAETVARRLAAED